MTKICAKCGAQMQDDELFCGECGTKLEDRTKNEERERERKENISQTQQMQGSIGNSGFCSKCGAPLSVNARFCNKCGAQRSGAQYLQNETQFSVPIKKSKAPRIIIGIVAAVIGILLILNAAGVLRTTGGGTVVKPDTISSTEPGSPTDSTADVPDGTAMGKWPADGYAALLPAPDFGTIIAVEDRGEGSYAVTIQNVTQADVEEYIAIAQNAGFVENGGEVTSENDEGGYHYASYNADGIRFEILRIDNEVGIFIGIAADS